MAERWAIWRAEKERRVADDRGAGVSAAAVFAALSGHLPQEAVVTVDVGTHAYSLGRYLESRGQPVLMSGYLGSIGFGYPAAVGAWAAAELCGATGIKVTSRHQLDPAMTALLATPGPVLLCIEQDADLL